MLVGFGLRPVLRRHLPDVVRIERGRQPAVINTAAALDSCFRYPSVVFRLDYPVAYIIKKISLTDLHCDVQAAWLFLARVTANGSRFQSGRT